MQKIYLAAPYTHPDQRERGDRVELASMVAARLMESGYVVFSPITHGHQVAKHLLPVNTHSHDFWMAQCLPMLKACDWMIILPLEGWRDSRGIREEADCAFANKIPSFIWQQFHPRLELLEDEEIESCGLSIFQGTF